MKLSNQANESLNAIRNKVMRQAIDINDQEFLHLDLVHREITKQSTGKPIGVSKGCSGCINNAVNILYNFAMFHEEKHEPIEKNTPNITTVSVKTRNELIKECKDKGITLPRNHNKETLIQLLNGKE